MSVFPSPNARLKAGAAFSLIELLVVMGLIGLLLSLAAPALLTTRSVGLSTAARESAALFESARARAMAMGSRVRVLIHDNAREEEAFRRTLQIVRADGNGGWVAEGNPILLPQDVVFDASQRGSAEKRMEFRSGTRSEAQWLYYEFGPGGTMDGNKRTFVLASGIVEASRVKIPDPNSVRGFRVSRNGRLLAFQSADQIREVAR